MGCCLSLLDCNDYQISGKEPVSDHDEMILKQHKRARYMCLGCCNCLEVRTSSYRTGHKYTIESKKKATSFKDTKM